MNGFYNILLVTLLSALIVFVMTLLPIWLGKKPIRRSLDKIAIAILLIFIISALLAYTQYTKPLLPHGIDNESTSIKAAWNNMGAALYKQGNYTGAIKYYDKAIEIDPEYVLAWSNKGDALKASHRDAEAEKAFAKAREKYE